MAKIYTFPPSDVASLRLRLNHCRDDRMIEKWTAELFARADRLDLSERINLIARGAARKQLIRLGRV